MKLPMMKIQTKAEYVDRVLETLHKDNLPFVKKTNYHLKLNDTNYYPTTSKIVFDGTHKVITNIYDTNQIKAIIENFEPINSLKTLSTAI